MYATRSRTMQAQNRKKCSVCQVVKPLLDFTSLKGGRFGVHPTCKPCRVIKETARRKANPQEFPKGYAVKQRLQRKYGLTVEDYENLSKGQRHACAICGTHRDHCRMKKLQVDHNHTTGNIRGLLCEHCNTLIGRARDHVSILQKAIAYLRERAW